MIVAGGPLDGEDVDLHPVMDTVVAVECPFPNYADFHLATARYAPDGAWVRTRCIGLSDERDVVLVEEPGPSD